jgi:hypothetical protein
LSVEELIVTLNAIGEKEKREQRFYAALKGINLDEEDPKEDDITSLKGWQADKEGFGIGMGLGHIVDGG